MDSSIYVVLVKNRAFGEPIGVRFDKVLLKHGQRKFVIICSQDDTGERMNLSSHIWIQNPKGKTHQLSEKFESQYERSAKLVELDNKLLSVLNAFGPKKKKLDQVAFSNLIQSYQIDVDTLFPESDGNESTSKHLSQEGSEEDEEDEDEEEEE